jgi:alpha-tubulin suppressor-like RCC1 family protein
LFCQILPRQVTGLGRRLVVAVAAAKHHTLVATSAGEVFSFGSNKDGRLGYAAVDSQPTPRK